MWCRRVRPSVVLMVLLVVVRAQLSMGEVIERVIQHWSCMTCLSNTQGVIQAHTLQQLLRNQQAMSCQMCFDYAAVSSAQGE